MYHTEGFVNKYTMDVEKHIIMLALEQEDRPWYLWCVIKESVAKTEELKQVLSFWLQQTLLTKGCKGDVYAQRELNRLGGYLQSMGQSKVTEDIELFMYYQGHFYRWDSNELSGNYYREYGAKEGISGYREIAKGVYGYVSEDALWQQYCCNHYESSDIELEKLANAWELSLIKACSADDIEQGFFLIWEDKSDF